MQLFIVWEQLNIFWYRIAPKFRGIIFHEFRGIIFSWVSCLTWWSRKFCSQEFLLAWCLHIYCQQQPFTKINNLAVYSVSLNFGHESLELYGTLQDGLVRLSTVMLDPIIDTLAMITKCRSCPPYWFHNVMSYAKFQPAITYQGDIVSPCSFTFVVCG